MAALLIFLGTDLVVAFGRIPFLRIDRTAAAIVGAILMVAFEVVPLDLAYRAACVCRSSVTSRSAFR